MYSNINDQQQFRLNRIDETKDYFTAEILEGTFISEILRK